MVSNKKWGGIRSLYHQIIVALQSYFLTILYFPDSKAHGLQIRAIGVLPLLLQKYPLIESLLSSVRELESRSDELRFIQHEMSKKKIKKDKAPTLKEITFYLVLSTFMSAVMFYSYFYNKHTDNSSVTGIYKDYEVLKENRRSKKRILVVLDSSSYFIKTIILPSFNEARFVKEIKKGSIINLVLENNSIIQISSLGKKYVNEEEREKLESRDSIFGLLLGIFFLLCSCMLVIKYRKLKSIKLKKIRN